MPRREWLLNRNQWRLLHAFPLRVRPSRGQLWNDSVIESVRNDKRMSSLPLIHRLRLPLVPQSALTMTKITVVVEQVTLSLRELLHLVEDLVGRHPRHEGEATLSVLVGAAASACRKRVKVCCDNRGKQYHDSTAFIVHSLYLPFSSVQSRSSP